MVALDHLQPACPALTDFPGALARSIAPFCHLEPCRAALISEATLSRTLSGQGRASTSLYLHRVCVERRETGRAAGLQRRDGGIDREGAFVGEGGLRLALRALRDPIR